MEESKEKIALRRGAATRVEGEGEGKAEGVSTEGYWRKEKEEMLEVLEGMN
jgi:hypothetical protein